MPSQSEVPLAGNAVVMKIYYVYVLKSIEKSRFYIGHSSNLERRTEGILSFEFDVEKPIFVFALFVELSYPFADLSDFAPDLKEETDSFSHV